MLDRIALLLVVIWLRIISVLPECVLPGSEDVNFNLLPGPWYIQLDSDPIIQDTKRCFLLQGFREIPGDAIYVTHRDLVAIQGRIEPGYTILAQRWIRTNGSRLLLDEQAVASWKVGISSNGHNTAVIEDDVEDLESSEKEPIVFITDYQTYIIVLRCVNGEKAVRTFSRHPIPREEDNCKVRDEIKKIGCGWENITLGEAGCDGVPIRDLIIN